jgi:tetratricopeptide (TPR) repeat protein
LGAAHVVEGSVRHTGDRLRVTARLINVHSGYHLWSEAYDRTITDVFAIQAELSQAIVTALEPRVGKPSITVRREPEPRSLDAYHAYLQGRFHRYQWTADSIAKSVEAFTRALQCEPEYAEALAGLSEVLALSAIWSSVDPTTHIAKAREAATRALSVSPTSSRAHLSLAWIHMVYDWEWKAAEREVQQALQLNPGSADAYHLYGFVQAVTDRLDETAKSWARAQHLDPLSLLINTHMAIVPYFSRQYAVAEELLRNVLAMDRNFAEAHWNLAWMHERQGRYPEACRHLRTAIDLGGENPYLLGDLASVHALMGQTDETTRLVRQLESTFRRPHAAATSIAYVHLSLGDLAQANAWIDAAIEVRDTMVPWICLDPRFERLWSHPALDDLRRRMRLD